MVGELGGGRLTSFGGLRFFCLSIYGGFAARLLGGKDITDLSNIDPYEHLVLQYDNRSDVLAGLRPNLRFPCGSSKV